MSNTSVHPFLPGARDQRTARLSGGVSLLLHAALFILVAFRAPPLQAVLSPPSPPEEQSFEIEDLAPIQETVEEVASDEKEGGSPDSEEAVDLPLPSSRVQPKPEPEPEPTKAPIVDPTPPVEDVVTEEVSQEAVEPETPETKEERPAKELQATPPSDPEPASTAQMGEDTQIGRSSGQGNGVGNGSGDGTGPPPRVDLFHNFLQKLPRAGGSDPTWTRLDRGSAGRVRFRVTIDSEGKLKPIQFLTRAGEVVPAHLRRLVLRGRKLLKGWRFLYYPDHLSGSRVFILDASVENRQADRETPGAPGVSDAGRLGLPKNNGAYFTYYSGRQINLLMYQEQ